MIFGGQTLLILDVFFLKNKQIVKNFIWCTVTAVILRCFQLLVLTMENTGFFIREYSVLGKLSSFLILILCVFPFMLSLNGKRQPSHPPAYHKPLCFAAYIVAAAVLIEVLTNGFAGTVPLFLVVLYRLSGILAAAVFVAYGCLGFVKKFNFLRGALILTVIFMFMRLVISFSSYSSLAGITDSYFDIFMLCSYLCFFLFFAKTVCFVSIKKSCFNILPSAFLSIFFTAVNTIPRLLMYMFKKSALVHPTPTYLFTNIAIGVFIGLFAFYLFSKSNFRVKRHTTVILPENHSDISNDSFIV